MRSALFLASIGGEVSVSPGQYWLIALAVVAVFAILTALAVAWAVVRRNPPIEREIDERIAAAIRNLEGDWGKRLDDLRGEMLRLNQERRVTSAGLFEKMEGVRKEAKADNESLQKTMQAGFMEVQRILGRLEAKTKE